MSFLLIAVTGTLALYVAGLAALALEGRRVEAVSLARLIPDCLVFTKRLIADRRVARRYKAVLLGLVAYLAMPFDLVPDFLPVIGLLDDVIVVLLALRYITRGLDDQLVVEMWPGSSRSLSRIVSG